VDEGGGLYFSDGISRTLFTLRTDGTLIPLITGLKNPKGVRGSDGPIVVDQGADALVASPYIQFNIYGGFSGPEGNNAVDFGNVPVGSSKTLTFTLLGIGRDSNQFAFDPGLLPGSDLPPYFSLSTLGASVPPGGSATVSITFSPTAAGPVTYLLPGGTAIPVTYDDNSFIYLKGTGVAAPH
jgi:hypothetical protein